MSSEGGPKDDKLWEMFYHPASETTGNEDESKGDSEDSKGGSVDSNADGGDDTDENES